MTDLSNNNAPEKSSKKSPPKLPNDINGKTEQLHVNVSEIVNEINGIGNNELTTSTYEPVVNNDLDNVKSISTIFKTLEENDDLYSGSVMYNNNNGDDFTNKKEFVIFKNQYNSLQKNNNIIIKDCKGNKRLLDLKYDNLTNWVNNIQTSVIFFSTISGFLQATRIQFSLNDTLISIISISISTYITLLLSISKYYKLDELKERIQNLREKYVSLHNRLEYRIDTLTPWNDKNLWIHQDAKKKLAEWQEIYIEMKADYEDIIKIKKELVSEFEIIMDTISRNKYMLINMKSDNNTRKALYSETKKASKLEDRIIRKKIPQKRKSIIKLQHDIDSLDDDQHIV